MEEPIDNISYEKKKELQQEFKNIISSLRKLCRKVDRLAKAEKGTTKIYLGDGDLMMIVGQGHDESPLSDVGIVWAPSNDSRILASEDCPVGGIFG